MDEPKDDAQPAYPGIYGGTEATLGERVRAAEILHEELLNDVYDALTLFGGLGGLDRSLSITDVDTGNRWTCTFEEGPK